MRTAAADNKTMAGSHLKRDVHPVDAPILDPRLGDFENDHSATKQRSLLAIAGSLLGEISVTKLVFSWLIQFLLPAVLLGMAPLILTAWIGEASSRFAEATGVGAVLIVLAALAAEDRPVAPDRGVVRPVGGRVGREADVPGRAVPALAVAVEVVAMPERAGAQLLVDDRDGVVNGRVARGLDAEPDELEEARVDDGALVDAVVTSPQFLNRRTADSTIRKVAN